MFCYNSKSKKLNMRNIKFVLSKKKIGKKDISNCLYEIEAYIIAKNSETLVMQRLRKNR